jgi:hypothetical protein
MAGLLAVLAMAGATSRAQAAHPRLLDILSQYEQTARASRGLLLPGVRGAALPERSARRAFRFAPDGRLMVRVYGAGRPAPDAVTAVGGRVLGVWQDLVIANVEAARLTELANQPGVRFVQPEMRPRKLDVRTGQEVARSAADVFHANYIDGGGATIIVWDMGFKSVNQFLGRELPPVSRVKKMYFGGTNAVVEGTELHGTMCAEIAHEMAPQANMILAWTEANLPLDQQIDQLLADTSPGKVVSYSVGNVLAPFDGGPGYDADQVQRFRTAGVPLVASAGNDAEAHHRARFTDTDADGYHEFAPGVETIDFRFTGSVQPVLQWDNYPVGRLWPQTDVDLRLEIVDAQGTVLAFSDTPQDGTQPPLEDIYFDDPAQRNQTLGLRIRLNSGGAAAITPNVDLFLFDYPTILTNRAITGGGAVQPASVPGVISVGAVDWRRNRRESYSTYGPTADGRVYPLLCGYDNVTVQSDRNPFQGTSAACPGVAGAMALLRSAAPLLTVDQLRDLLLRNTQDIQTPGVDNETGYGALLLGLDKLPQATGVTLSVATRNRGDGGLPIIKGAGIQVSYVYLGGRRSIELVEDVPAVVKADPGSTVTFAPLNNGGGTQRWAAPTDATLTFTVPAADTALPTVGYYHQVNAAFVTQLQAEATPLQPGNTLEVSVPDRGGQQRVAVGPDPLAVWVDAGGAYTTATVTSGSTGEERWVTANLQPITGTVAATTATVSLPLYHQVRPQVVLSGTSADNTVDVTGHTLFGAQVAGPEVVSGTFAAWADTGSYVTFADHTNGAPLRVAVTPRQLKVVPGLLATVEYDVQPTPQQSGVSSAVKQAPADGQTLVGLVLTVKDSAGKPVSGIDVNRLALRADPVSGLQITAPTGVTNARGQATWRVSRALPGAVLFTALLDNLALPATSTVRFQRVMTMPLPVAGLYLVSFPLQVENSREQLADMAITPKPSQLARYNPVTRNYRLFKPTEDDPALAVLPGRGYFLRTTTPGSATLYGTWSDELAAESALKAYYFPMPEAGFQMVGNPRTNGTLPFRLSDFRVIVDGADIGTLEHAGAWESLDPFLWVYNGRGYQLVMDPSMAGTPVGTRAELQVFEGAFWRSRRPNVAVLWQPTAGYRGAPAPAGPSLERFALTLVATAGAETAQAVVGVQGAAVRSARPPAVEGAPALALDVLGADGSRAAVDFAGTPLRGARTWTLRVSAPVGQDVALSWPSLARALPAGCGATLSDPTTGRTVSLATSSGYTFRGQGERELALTIAPRAAQALAITSLVAQPTRARGVSFTAQVTGDSELVLRIASLNGRLVSEVGPVRGNGTVSLSWNGLDAAGRPVPQGVYWATLTARGPDGETTRATRTVTVR